MHHPDDQLYLGPNTNPPPDYPRPPAPKGPPPVTGNEFHFGRPNPQLAHLLDAIASDINCLPSYPDAAASLRVARGHAATLKALASALRMGS